jgi:protein CWC15
MSRVDPGNSPCGTWPHTPSSNSGAKSHYPCHFRRHPHRPDLLRQPGQTSTGEVQKRDLRAELLAAEQEARNKKRKAEGKAPLPVEGEGDEETNKRRKLIQEALDLDKDDEDEDDDDKEAAEGQKDGDNNGRNEDDDEEEDSDEEEDDTAELLRELEKIKRERAEEKARQDAETSASAAAQRETEIATANPLLNLAWGLGQQTPGGVNTTVPGTFAVKKRWDDGALSLFSLFQWEYL